MSVAIDIALHAAPAIRADMPPASDFAGPVVSLPHAARTMSAAAATIVDECRMIASGVRRRGSCQSPAFA